MICLIGIFVEECDIIFFMEMVYIETSIVSYLTARPARSVQAAAWQEATFDWWEIERHRFSLFTSELVIEEAGKGNPAAAVSRVNSLKGIKRLAVTDEVVDLTEVLLAKGALPHVAADDAMHVALSAYHQMDFLLTWNCRHIANAEKKPLIRSVCESWGCVCPEICTPFELMGDNDER